MPITAIVTLNVPDLPDADVWFANAAAWKNYWRQQIANVTIEPAATTLYVPSAYDTSLVPFYTNIDGVDYVLVTTAMFDSLMNRLDTLENSYQALRTQLKDAGLITNAQ